MQRDTVFHFLLLIQLFNWSYQYKNSFLNQYEQLMMHRDDNEHHYNGEFLETENRLEQVPRIGDFFQTSLRKDRTIKDEELARYLKKIRALRAAQASASANKEKSATHDMFRTMQRRESATQ